MSLLRNVLCALYTSYKIDRNIVIYLWVQKFFQEFFFPFGLIYYIRFPFEDSKIKTIKKKEIVLTGRDGNSTSPWRLLILLCIIIPSLFIINFSINDVYMNLLLNAISMLLKWSLDK